jgi:hypothetical protein
MLQGWREKVGPDFPLSLDCYMSLSVPYVQPIFGSVADRLVPSVKIKQAHFVTLEKYIVQWQIRVRICPKNSPHPRPPPHEPKPKRLTGQKAKDLQHFQLRDQACQGAPTLQPEVDGRVPAA